MALTFNGDYADHTILPSGEHLRLRLVRPSDKDHLQRGFSALSTASRMKRFLGSKAAISEAELRYFTELDQFDHFAIGVIEINAAGEEGEGAGIARFIRFDSDPGCAEVAITVTDRMQRKGIGRWLLDSLINAARERDIKQFRFECLPHNLEMQRLVRSVCCDADLSREDGLVLAKADLPDPCEQAYDQTGATTAGLFDSFQVFAAETLEWQIGIGLQTLFHTLDFVFDPTSAWRSQSASNASS